MYRVFVAIDLPEEVKYELSCLSYGIPGVRWVEAEQLHMTIRFIGEVDGAVFADISDQLSSVCLEPFSFMLQSIGHFPPRGMPRVLWVGVSDSSGLRQLRTKVDSVLHRLNVPLENRKYSPHITLARLKNPPRTRISDFIAANNLYKSREIEVTSFHLYSSVLTAKGAIHTCEHSYGMSGRD